MRIEWDTPIDALMHSDTIAYIDLDEDEIMHWKYIKKERRPNGKWRYYYDWKDALGFDERDRYRNAARENAVAQHELWSVKQNNANTRPYIRDPFAPGGLRDNPKYASNQHVLSNTTARAEKAGRDYLSAKSDYMKTPLGKLEKTKDTIKKGVQKVKSWFKGLFK